MKGTKSSLNCCDHCVPVHNGRTIKGNLCSFNCSEQLLAQATHLNICSKVQICTFLLALSYCSRGQTQFSLRNSVKNPQTVELLLLLICTRAHSALRNCGTLPRSIITNYVISCREIPESSFTVCTCATPDALGHHDWALVVLRTGWVKWWWEWAKTSAWSHSCAPVTCRKALLLVLEPGVAAFHQVPSTPGTPGLFMTSAQRAQTGPPRLRCCSPGGPAAFHHPNKTSYWLF